MRTIKLAPEKIITAEEAEIANPELFAVYHRVFKYRQGKILPPVVVVRGEAFHDRIPHATIFVLGTRTDLRSHLFTLSSKELK